MSAGPVDNEPALRVVRGDASPEEIAALVVALAALRRDSEPGRNTTARSVWNDRSRLLRSPVHPSPDGWRRSALPR
ncbi:MAG: acyl-CoA carboxylase subunit epsilon [Streptosporangiaceae bacterium]|nr:acyl-CoA carboxylase subunit epsilon [Streptosporangiaceae bacterium]